MKRKIVSWTFIVIWCSVIFYMSSRNGDQSSGMSQLVAQVLNHALRTIFGSHAITIPEIVIRKLAHFTEYLLLGMLLLSGLFNKLRPLRSFLFALVAGTIYAASDEFHQIFIPGRTAAAHDVLIDAAGVLCGALIMLKFLSHKKYPITLR